MDQNTTNLLISLIPKVLAFIKGFHAASGTLPTEEQILAAVNLKADEVVKKSDLWLKEHDNA